MGARRWQSGSSVAGSPEPQMIMGEHRMTTISRATEG
jgi:hypothetical protein